MARVRPEAWPPAWTFSDDAVLRSLYVAQGAQACAKALPTRSLSAIMHRAARLHLTTHRRWSAQDDAQLRLLWGDGFTLDTVARKIGRTAATTYWRAQKLGMPLGVPQGYESISDAERRTGFDRSQIYRICRWAEVRVLRTMSRPSKPRGKGRARHNHRFWCVDPVALDDAIERWMATEPLEAHARRLSVSGESVRRWLIDAGHEPPAVGKVHWRITGELADAVVLSNLTRFRKHRKPRSSTSANVNRAGGGER